MNLKKYLFSAFTLFTFIFFYEILVHDFLLKEMYEASANTWRDFVEMEARMPMAMCFQMALSIWTAFVFSRIYPEGGIKKGLLFGLFFGGFAGILTATWYLWLNVPGKLAVSWFCSSIIEGVGGGIILGTIYHKKPLRLLP